MGNAWVTRLKSLHQRVQLDLIVSLLELEFTPNVGLDRTEQILKTGVGQPTGGSNPSPSATRYIWGLKHCWVVAVGLPGVTEGNQG